MYFPASHLSHSPSLSSTPTERVSEYSPLLSFSHFDPLGGLLPSPSTDQSADSFSIYLKLFSLILLTLLVLIITGFFLFHHTDALDPSD